MTRSTIHAQLLTDICAIHPSLYELAGWIPYMSIPWRKYFLDVCQTGYTRETHPWMNESYQAIKDTPVYNQHDEKLDILRITTFSSIILTGPIIASFISMLLRCEATLQVDDGSLGELRRGIRKELKAALTPFKNRSTLRWSSIFFPYRGTALTIFAPLTPSWIETAQAFTGRLKYRLGRLPMMFPKVQRKKNMAESSRFALLSNGYETEKTFGELGTVDLELMKLQSGVEIQGECELRWAWKYNDLKPRAYYCIGGSNYWKSRHMKQVAIAFMESLPITSAIRRSCPSELARMMSSDTTVLMWDYTSFTTNLSELKYFMYYVARYLEEDLYLRQNPVRIFDYASGISEVFIWDLLDSYNEEVNDRSAFSIHRILDDIEITDIDSSIFNQENSGMLGVHGNIGFSTSVHGLHGAAIAVDQHSGVGIGDDEMILVGPAIDIESEAIPHIQELGEISIGKFGIFGPSEDEQGWKFVKRPFRRYAGESGLYFGHLFDWPLLAYVAMVRSDNRKFPEDKTLDRRIKKFVTQVAAFLWAILSFSHRVTDEDLVLIRSILFRSYRHLQLPTSGMLPGYHHPVAGQLFLAIPSIQFALYDPREEDWAEFLWRSRPMKFCKLPKPGLRERLPELYIGLEFEAVSDKYVRVLEDIGIVEKQGIQSEWVETTEDNMRRFREVVSGCDPVYLYKVLKNPPSYHDDVMQAYYGSVTDLLFPTSLEDGRYMGVYTGGQI